MGPGVRSRRAGVLWGLPLPQGFLGRRENVSTDSTVVRLGAILIASTLTSGAQLAEIQSCSGLHSSPKTLSAFAAASSCPRPPASTEASPREILT